MTVPLDTVNDIRSMDAAGRSRSEIARMLHVSRNTVAKYADMEDMSPAAPMPRRRGRPALEGNEEWVAGVLEADLGAPRKQRHTARRIYDRLVAERGYGGSYSTVQRFVRELRLARAAAGGEGYLELLDVVGAELGPVRPGEGRERQRGVLGPLEDLAGPGGHRRHPGRRLGPHAAREVGVVLVDRGAHEVPDGRLGVLGPARAGALEVALQVRHAALPGAAC